VRLKRWQPAAIILSIAWIVGGGAYQWSAYTTRAHSQALAEYESCIEVNVLTHVPAANLCAQRASRTLTAELRRLWLKVALVALLPVAVAWLAVYLILAVRRLA
jgi:hypothetical protein